VARNHSDPTAPEFGAIGSKSAELFLQVEYYGPETRDAGRLYLGDNLQVLSILAEELGSAFDFVYIDPPFCTGNRYPRQRILRDEGDRQEIERVPAYNDQWEGGLEAYLAWLEPRLEAIHRVLAPNGSFVIHLDWRAASHVRLLADRIFGADQLRNEIVWYKGFRGTRAKRIFQHSHDILWWYTKGDEYFWEQDFEPYRDEELKRYNKVDESGRRYALIKRRRTDGTVYYGRTYPGSKGKWRNDVIADVPTMAATSGERTGYATQKPVRLLEILVRSLCPPGGLVGDFFCGTGSTLRAAWRLGRRFVGVDENPLAVHLARLGLLREGDSVSFAIFRPARFKPAPRKESWVGRRSDGRVILRLPPSTQPALEWWAVGEAEEPFRPLWFSPVELKEPPPAQSPPLPHKPLRVLAAFHDGTEKWASLK